MLSRSIGSALKAGPSRTSFTARRAISTTLPLLRQQDRVPQGHVRPLRRPPHIRSQPSFPANPSSPSPLPIEETFTPFAQGGNPSRLPVHVPDDPKGVLDNSHAVRDLLANDALVIVRQLEMLNVFMGFEQANRYAIYTPEGHLVGYMAEEGTSILSTMTRQFLHTHRPFRSTVMDPSGAPILWIRRPFAFINSRIFVHASEGTDARLVGETQQQWHPWRRKYNLFQARDEETFSQFARIDSGLLAWDFWLKDRDDRLVASINRNFSGFGREIFTDTGQYVIRFDSAGMELDMPPGSNVNLQGQSLILPDEGRGGLTLDQRALTLATAVSIDFDYFSRHSGSGGMGFPFIFWGGGDGGSDVAHGRGTGTGAGAGDGVATGAAAGAAGAAGAGAGMDPYESGREATDEEIYGPQGSQGPLSRPDQHSNSDASPSDWAEEDYGHEDLPWGESGDGEEMMDDPWADQNADDGFFGGGGGGGGDGGSWGDWS